ncbi:MAG: hypothetical protein H7061_03540 [Bdellovibrionaceae bacterium]|nr:hypothetical protein [Bdellovibrio sp.]
MLTKEEEQGLLEILKENFPKLDGQGLVISMNEFLSPEINLQNFICKGQSTKEAAVHYIKENIPYIILDESEGYRCIFFKGNHLRVQYDATNSKVVRLIEESQL